MAGEENDGGGEFWDHAFKALEHLFDAGKQREQRQQEEAEARANQKQRSRRPKTEGQRTSAQAGSTESAAGSRFAGGDSSVDPSCCVVGRKKVKL